MLCQSEGCQELKNDGTRDWRPRKGSIGHKRQDEVSKDKSERVWVQFDDLSLWRGVHVRTSLNRRLSFRISLMSETGKCKIPGTTRTVVFFIEGSFLSVPILGIKWTIPLIMTRRYFNHKKTSPLLSNLLLILKWFMMSSEEMGRRVWIVERWVSHSYFTTTLLYHHYCFTSQMI